jgi:hypothetical protein
MPAHLGQRLERDGARFNRLARGEKIELGGAENVAKLDRRLAGSAAGARQGWRSGQRAFSVGIAHESRAAPSPVHID